MILSLDVTEVSLTSDVFRSAQEAVQFVYSFVCFASL